MNDEPTRTMIYPSQKIAKLREENVKLRAALADTKAPWRPIESAPKDGTKIMVWKKGYGPTIAMWSPFIGMWLDHSSLAVGGLADKPKWWLPLPPAPEAER